MKGLRLTVAVFAIVVGVASCGDNSRQCGEGTHDDNGICKADLPPSCSGGTILDEETNSCVIDPNACQDGTVLVGAECVDPGRVDVDLEEAAEPNGLGVFGEDSTTDAGTIALKPEGEHFVIHGKIIPFQDEDADGQNDADFDTYDLTVQGPTLLTVSVDGLHGLAGGFASVAAVAQTDPIAQWTRFGINLSGDTSKRQLYLPKAGTYVIVIADTRSLFLAGGAAGAEEGADDFEYYATVDVTPIPAPTALTVTDGLATHSGALQPGEVQFFSVADMGLGVNDITLQVPSVQNASSLVVEQTSGAIKRIRAVADGDNTTPAEAALLGFRAGDTTLIVADHVFNYALQPVNFTLNVQAGDAGELSTDGNSVAQPGSDTDFSVFFYDVGSDLEVTGMDLHFDVPVEGVIVDDNFNIFSLFTFDVFFGFTGETFQDYVGLLRHPTAGRYYFLVFDDNFDPNNPTDITATSTYAAQTVGTITEGTPLTTETTNAFDSNPYTYDAGTTDAWQLFNGTAGGAGATAANFFDPATAFGRLDPLPGVSCFFSCDDTFPEFTHTYASDGSTPVGRILLDDPITSYFVTFNAEDGAGTNFTVDFARRDHTDLGTLDMANGASVTGETLDNTTTTHRYLLRTDPGNTIDVTASPVNGLSTEIQQLDDDESAIGNLINNGTPGNPDTVTIAQTGRGWTAFEVTAASGSGTFDLDVGITEPPYAVSAGSTTFSDACTGGTEVAMSDTDEGASTALIDTPANFEFFGTAAGSQFRVFSNGFISFDTALACSSVGGSCFFSNVAMPDAGDPNEMIAPYWDDLVVDANGGVCQKTVGNTLVIQWTGVTFGGGEDVQFQAILDPTDSSIEFVYSNAQVPTGSGATIGVEDAAGAVAKSVTSITPGASVKFTPQ